MRTIRNTVMLVKLIKHYLRDQRGLFADWIKKNGEVSQLRTGMMNLHLFLNPTFIKHIYFDNHANYVKPAKLIALRDLIGEKSLFTTEDYVFWRQQRDLLMPIMSPESVAKHVGKIAANTMLEIEKWDSNAVTKKPMNLMHSLELLSFSNMKASLFEGVPVDFESFNEVAREMFYLLSSASKVMALFESPRRKLRLNNWRREFDRLAKSIMLDERTKKSKVVSVLAAAYDAAGLTEQEKFETLKSEVLGIMMVANTSIAATLGWVFAYVSLNPNVAVGIQNEIRTKLGNRQIEADDVTNLTYTNAVVLETMRLQPLNTLLFKQSVADDKIGSHIIRKGDITILPLLHYHRLPEYWPNPLAFNPDRFLTPLPEQYKFIYMPFGVGPRSCIGRHFAMTELVTVLVTVMQRYELELTSDSTLTCAPMPFNSLNANVSVSLKRARFGAIKREETLLV